MSPRGDNSNELKLALQRIKAQGENNISDYHKALLKWHKNVDKNYAWVILAALFAMMVSTLGPYRLYSLMFAAVTSEGVYTREEASWPVSMIFTVENLIGPLVSIICYHLTYYQCMLIGGTLLAMANGLCALSSSLVIDVLLIGVVQGIGYAFIFMPFMEIINSYFLKYRNTALGLALSGGTISVFFWSPLFQWILEVYPLRYFYYGIGLVCCINLIAVPFLKPNPMPKFIDEGLSNKMKTNVLDRTRKLSRISIRALTYQNSLRRQNTILISRTSNKQRHASVISVNPFASSVGLERKISRAIAPDLHTQSLSGSTNNQTKQTNGLSQFSVQPKKFNSVSSNNVVALGDRDDISMATETISISEVGQDSDFDTYIIWEVLKTPGFHLIWYNELIYFWIFSIYCLVMVDFSIDRGCTKDEAEGMLSFQSMGELVGRLVLTVLVDMRFISNKNVVTLVLFLLAGLLVLVTHVHGYIWMASITLATSSFLSLLYILINGLLVDYLGEQRVTIGYGMASCIGGLLMSFRPYAVGYFRDQHGSYDYLMICLALSCLVGAFLWLLEPIMSKAVNRPARNGMQQDSSC